jgi:hypothetical protein
MTRMRIMTCVVTPMHGMAGVISMISMSGMRVVLDGMRTVGTAMQRHLRTRIPCSRGSMLHAAPRSSMTGMRGGMPAPVTVMLRGHVMSIMFHVRHLWLLACTTNRSFTRHANASLPLCATRVLSVVPGMSFKGCTEEHDRACSRAPWWSPGLSVIG